METIHLYNLSNLCRVCLSQTTEMSDIYDSSKGLHDIFTSVVDFELEKNEAFPNYLCTNCEEKLIICYEFIKQCKKTNDKLISYKESDYKIDDDTKISFESLPVTEIIEFISNDAKSYDTNDFQEDNETKVRKLRLKQYPHKEVMEAIQEFKGRFSEVKSCVKCKFQGRNSRALATHMTFMHKETKGRWCIYCNEEFDDLNEHSIGHKNIENICKFCGKNMTGRGRLLEHLRSHTVIRPHRCDLCDMTFVSSRHLRVHYRKHTNEKPYKCAFCKQSFSQSALLKTHSKRYHTGDDNFHCKVCKKSFENEENLQDHVCGNDEISGIPGKLQTKQNYCTICCKKVRSLNVHNRNHHESRDSSAQVVGKLCTVCGKQFKDRSHLVVHMRTHTGETPYSCSYCDRKMGTRNHLVMHERTHTGDKPHVCTICKKGFSQTSILNTHMKLHTGRPEMCLVCGKRFCRPAELRLHLRKHTGEKPFVCSYCGKSFIQKSHLVEHTRRHLDEKPFRCGTCSKRFTQRSSLKTHMQIHTGEKPYKCSQCAYACRQSYSLKVHMKHHTDDAPRPDKPHSCTYCHKTYSTLAMLNSHVGSVHFPSE